MLKIVEWCEENGKLLIVDESFVDFSECAESLLCNSVLERYRKSLVVVRSVSKSCGLSCLRLSILASGDVDAISVVRDNIGQWNINSVVEFALQIFSKYESDYKDSCQRFIKGRRRLAKALQGISFFRVVPSQSGYVMCEIKNKYTAEQLSGILIERNVQVCGQGKFVRFAVRSKDDNDKLLKVLSAL